VEIVWALFVIEMAIIYCKTIELHLRVSRHEMSLARQAFKEHKQVTHAVALVLRIVLCQLSAVIVQT
ncbi:MAG: hypothetical protein Q8Q54_12770, partial [Methylococcales bacterium]|nr:hypothetical protein [Methylococcales bacterium]